MSNNPFEHNTNYTLLFKVRSDQTYCDIWETVELYQHKTDKFYILFRYQVNNQANFMPRRVMHKFDDLIISEVEDTGNRMTLYITTSWKSLNSVSHRVNICCGSRSYVLNVEANLYKYLLK
jgi:hypothetical protein